jgi:hemerythrin-like domain-containing protein
MATTTHTTTPAPGAAPVRSAGLESYLRIHRALRTSARALAGTAGEPADRATTAARVRWYRGFAGEIRCHHHIEDELLFPALRDRVATYADHAARLDGDHADLDVVLDGLSDALAAGDHGRAGRLAGELADHLDEHLAYEDAEIAPLFARHFTTAEFDELNAKAITMTPPRQLSFTVPWLMASITPDEQAVVLAEAPKVMRLVWRATRGRYGRRSARALGV